MRKGTLVRGASTAGDGSGDRVVQQNCDDSTSDGYGSSSVGELGVGNRVRQKRQLNALSHTMTDRFGRRERAQSDRENGSRSSNADRSEQHIGAGRQMAA
jgi:hypothetical protein